MNKTLKLLERSLELRIRKIRTDYKNGYIGSLDLDSRTSELEEFKRKCSDIKFIKSYVSSPKYWSEEEYNEILELLEE